MTLQGTSANCPLTRADFFPPRMLGCTPDIRLVGPWLLVQDLVKRPRHPHVGVYNARWWSLQSSKITGPPQYLSGTMKSSVFFALLATFLPTFTLAQSAVYGQCGGIGWSKSSIQEHKYGMLILL